MNKKDIITVGCIVAASVLSLYSAFRLGYNTGVDECKRIVNAAVIGQEAAREKEKGS